VPGEVASLVCAMKMVNVMVENKESMATVSTEAQDKKKEQLSSEDLERVNKYLSSPVHQVERKPFRPWLMMLLLVLTVLLLSGLSLLISWLVIE